MVLHMHSIRNKAYIKAYKQIGKCTTGISNYSQTIELFKQLFYNNNKVYKDKLTNLYLSTPNNNLKIVNEFGNNNDNFKSLLYHLSCNVTKSKQNSRFAKHP